VGDDTWAGLADKFADQAYASVKGLVRTQVMHQHLLEHLPIPPATVLDVGGGAGHQSFPLAAAGYDVTLLDPSPAMLAKAEQRLQELPAEAQRRVTLLVLGVPGRADTVEELSELLRRRSVEPVRWYGVWLFVDWLEFSGAELDPSDSKQVAVTAAVELEASRRDPYRQLSRVFHLVGRKGPS
jgi:SAM-dependent methyltransferase